MTVHHLHDVNKPVRASALYNGKPHYMRIKGLWVASVDMLLSGRMCSGTGCGENIAQAHKQMVERLTDSYLEEMRAE